MGGSGASIRGRESHRQRIVVCDGTYCRAHGSSLLLAECRRQLEVRSTDSAGEVEFILEQEQCLGMCLFAPVIAVDDRYHCRVAPWEIASIVEQAREAPAGEANGSGDVEGIEAHCPHCSRGLMDPEQRIDGLPSILLTGITRHRQGWIRLSSVFSSYHVESEFPIDAGTIIAFYCPACSERLAGGDPCPDCGAPMVLLSLPDGTGLRFCARRGCRSHHLDPGFSQPSSASRAETLNGTSHISTPPFTQPPPSSIEGAE